MALYITVHARYHDVQCGLFDGDTVLVTGTHESKKISGQFTLLFDEMLMSNNYTLSDLSYIAVHQGPAPFTTLRVCLAAVNGIAFASQIPLIGVSGLDALLDEYKQLSSGTTIALLNAFSNDLYFAIDDPKKPARSIWYGQGIKVIEELMKNYSGACTFLGNGSTLYKETIEHLFGSRAHIIPSDVASLTQIARTAHQLWNRQATSSQLLPIYLKEYSVRSLRP